MSLDIQSLSNHMIILDISNYKWVIAYVGVKSCLLDQTRGCQF